MKHLFSTVVLSLAAATAGAAEPAKLAPELLQRIAASRAQELAKFDQPALQHVRARWQSCTDAACRQDLLEREQFLREHFDQLRTDAEMRSRFEGMLITLMPAGAAHTDEAGLEMMRAAYSAPLQVLRDVAAGLPQQDPAFVGPPIPPEHPAAMYQVCESDNCVIERAVREAQRIAGEEVQ